MNQNTYNCVASDTATQLVDYLFGPIRWQIIDVALDLLIFDELIEPKTSESVANTLSLEHNQTTLLLNALCGLGFVRKENAYYHLDDQAAPYLISNSQQSMRDMLLHLSRVRHADKETIKHILHTGNSEHLSSQLANENFWNNSFNCLYSFQSSIGNQVVLDIFKNLSNWQTANRILDLGAGSESLSKAIINQRPNMEITIFDLPKCAARIKKRILGENNINVIEGDFNKDNIGCKYDIIWASMSLYYAEDMHKLLCTIKQSLNPGGVFLSYHEALSDNRTAPEKHITGRFLPSISGNDLSFDDGVIAKEIKQAGFNNLHSSYVNTAFGEMRLDIGYK